MDVMVLSNSRLVKGVVGNDSTLVLTSGLIRGTDRVKCTATAVAVVVRRWFT